MIEIISGLIALVILLALLISPIALIVLLIKSRKRQKKIQRYTYVAQGNNYLHSNGYNTVCVNPAVPNYAERNIQSTNTAQPEQEKIDYKKSYQAKYLLTQNEWHEYKKLRELAASRDLQVFPKVRLLDIIEPRKGESNYMALMGKIKSKHIDFLICDSDLHIKGIVELDDSSHDQKERQERDQFVDEILSSVGYTVIRTRYITEHTLNRI